jgi:hypothetical protein
LATTNAPKRSGRAGRTATTNFYELPGNLGATVHALNVSGSSTSAVASSFEDSSAAYLFFSVTATNTTGTGPADTTTNGVTPDVGVKSTTVVLSSDTVDDIAASTPTSITWSSPVPQQIQDLSTGDVLVAGVNSTLPDGLMQTVTEISATSDGTTLTVAQASLGDVFSNMTMATSIDPSASTPSAGGSTAEGSRAQFVPASPGIQPMAVKPSDIGVGRG